MDVRLPTRPDWHTVAEVERIPSPALLIYVDRVAENVRRMIDLAGDPARLRPHVKTHKLAEIVRLQLQAGIRKFKCATLAEAQMLAQAGADEVLVAFQLAGPLRRTLAQLIRAYPGARFGLLVDNLPAIELLEAALANERVAADAYVDLDVGMHRTGIAPGPEAAALFDRLAASSCLRPAGVHVYDGHLKQHDPLERERASDRGFEAVNAFVREMAAAGMPGLEIIAGGSPTFAIHARHPERTLSPGTCVFWDWAYASKFPDLDFLHAAMVLTRVISRPAADLVCLDLGYKAVSPDNPDPRVYFPQIPDAQMAVHSEEHLLIRTADAGRWRIDDCLYGIPYHVCPTVALYDEAIAVRDGRAFARWPIVARRRSVELPATS